MSVKALPAKEPQFSKLRAALWPIQGKEMKKFLPMSLMMFFILFVYSVVRCTKDTLVVGASQAEALSFVKLFGVLPASVIFFLFFAKISSKLSRERVFYLLVGSFVLFFGAFAVLIYPNRGLLHPSPTTVEHLQHAYPMFKHFFSLWGTWSYSIFFIAAELWGSVCLSLLFWQFANDIIKTNEAKRFYSLLPLLANVALVVVGPLIDYLSVMGKKSGVADPWGYSLNYLMALVVIAGLATMAIYWWINRKVLTDPEQYDPSEEKKIKKEKPKLSIIDGFKYITSSRYLGCIALLVLCYGVSINLVEITWKSQLKLQYPDKNDYNAFMGQFIMITGLVTIAFIMLSKGIIRRWGWFSGAVLTPIVLGITGTLFYTFVIFRGDLGWLSAAMGVTPVMMAVIFGTIQNFLSKATKYSLFDPTKEMAYIPLDQELKVRGKAAVDVIGGRFGKSGGAIIQSVLLMIFTTASQITLAPVFAVTMIAMTVVWIFSAKRLAKLYNRQVTQAEQAPAIEVGKLTVLEAPEKTALKAAA